MYFNLQKFNLYDYLLVLIISSLSFGGYGGSLQPIRIFTLVLLPIVLYVLIYGNSTRVLSYLKLSLFFFFIYITISLFWSSNLNEGYKELIYYFIHIFLFLTIVVFSRYSNNPFRAITLGWVIVFIVTFPIALYEIFLNVHLPISKFSSDKVINLGSGLTNNKKFASATFEHYNTYVTVLVYSFPFLLINLLRKSSVFKQIINWILVLILLFIVIVNASRGGILAIAVVLIVFFVFYSKNVNYRYKIPSYLIVFFLFCISIYFFENIFNQLLFRLETKDNFFSDENRLFLFYASFELLSKTYFMGTGIGGIHISMSNIGSNITIPHNLFLEVLVQHGIILFFLFLLLIWSIIKFSFSNYNMFIRFLTISFLFALFPSSVVNSGYLLMPAVWVIFASMFVLNSVYISKI